MDGWLGVVIMIALGVGFAGVMIGLSLLLGPKNPTPEKLAPYECGVTPVGTARERFHTRFYLVAMLFIVFDIETVFLYPWAIVFKQLRIFGLIEMAVFVGILLVGLVYAWKKGALEWQ